MNRLQSGTKVFVSMNADSFTGTLVNDFDGTGPVVLQNVILLDCGIPYLIEKGIGYLRANDSADDVPHEVFIPLNAIEFITKLPEVKQ